MLLFLPTIMYGPFPILNNEWLCIFCILFLKKIVLILFQLTNAMDNMGDQLRSMTQQQSGPLSQESVLHYQEKWNHLVELHVQLESTGKNFLAEIPKVVGLYKLVQVITAGKTVVSVDWRFISLLFLNAKYAQNRATNCVQSHINCTSQMSCTDIAIASMDNLIQ